MTFLLTLGLGLVGVGLSVAVVRAAMHGDVQVSWSAAVAIAVAGLVVASGLVNAGDSYQRLRDRRAQWEPLTEAEALDNPSAPVAGVDPEFSKFAKSHLLRGQTFYLTRSASDTTRLWLGYRLAPNIMEDRIEEADWIVYWQKPDAVRELGLSRREIEAHLQFTAEAGMIKVRRES